MDKKVAFLTQSYIKDFDECRLLCESIDLFAPTIPHFIFVNDEDINAFQSLNYNNHHVYKKGTILPKYLVNIPFKIAGHQFYVSPITIPVREWIIQQICKLGVFEVIGDEYDAVFNIDSEIVFMRPFDVSKWVNEKGDFMLFRNILDNEPSKAEYEAANKKLLSLTADEMKSACKWNYMNMPTCFERENTKLLLNELAKNVWFGGWKRALCNTYRFSENYLYATFVSERLNFRNHYITDERTIPLIGRILYKNENDFRERLCDQLSDQNVVGVWLQKKNRKSMESDYLKFEDVERAVKSLW